MDLDTIQEALRAAHIDAWLFYDHHHRDPIAASILGLPDTGLVSRRWYYVVPAEGAPRKLVHRIEAGKLDALPGSKGAYSSWQELEGGLEAMLEPFTRIAMQYSPNNAIMYVSMVDAGTVELVRSFGKDVVSSADLVSLSRPSSLRLRSIPITPPSAPSTTSSARASSSSAAAPAPVPRFPNTK